MKLFRRSKTVQPNVPPEVAEYYQAERKQRRGAAWFMTAVTLLATVAIVVGLFLGGRWLYTTARNRNNKPVAVKTTQDNKNDKVKSASTGSSDSSGSSSTGTQGTSDTQDSRDNRDNSGTDNSGANNTAPSAPPATTEPSTPAQTPAPSTPETQQSPSGATALTNTGPGDSASVVFVSVSVLSYVLYRRKLANQQN